MAKVEGVDKVQAILRDRIAKGKQDDDVSVVVGFTQVYAVHVHENLQAHHPVGQAKFLEQPARTLREELKKIIVGACKRGVPLPKALLLAGLRLQREAQLLCPVDTGALRASAFTRLEEK